LANINRNILLNDIHHYAKLMKSGSLLFLSGFYTEDIPAIEAECEKYGLKKSDFKVDNNWTAVKFVMA
jgi:ribosomal protein L11 methyltransferase